MTINREQLPVLYSLIAGALFASGTPLAKLFLTDIPPLSLASVLYLGSATGLLICFAASKIISLVKNETPRSKKEAPLSKKDIPWFLGSAFSGSVLSTIILMISLQHVHAVTASMLLSFEAVASTLIAVTVCREPVGRRVWAALCLITLACLALAYSPGSEFGLSLGALGIVLTCICWGIDTNIERKLSSKDPFEIILAKGMTAGTVLFIIAMVSGSAFPSPEILIPAMTVGFISFGGFMMILYIYGLRELGAARASSLFGMNPVFGVIASFLIFRELPGILFFPALFLMVSGLFLLSTEKHSHLHTHPAETHEHRHHHPDIHHEHEHTPDDPPLDRFGYHSHLHTHTELTHTHAHRPDIHHRHRHY
ncbi:drug/metabolite transporter (DMT)-like permease [Methanomicrobium sp. W14]|uniref:DMT family transporter n=1 Tax=Methanomicrobium sp. W14 TaxID=2817839 RepID=UPI001AE1F96E|nr:DMT family transporter [Methanomicrobium sp. W14]MBP2134122.1 drug/metabolite transporter (DMT)-like permease [Methanomicrobium sp. W14]